MAKILHQLIGSLSRFYIPQVVQDFFHQQYETYRLGIAQPNKNGRIPSIFSGDAWFIFFVESSLDQTSI